MIQLVNNKRIQIKETRYLQLEKVILILCEKRVLTQKITSRVQQVLQKECFFEQLPNNNSDGRMELKRVNLKTMSLIKLPHR